MIASGREYHILGPKVAKALSPDCDVVLGTVSTPMYAVVASTIENKRHVHGSVFHNCILYFLGHINFAHLYIHKSNTRNHSACYCPYCGRDPHICHDFSSTAHPALPPKKIPDSKPSFGDNPSGSFRINKKSSLCHG